ncbi:MAG: formate dehydrogenase accessory sulfurtransferase FdhD [Alphaproteobacteria bacterium]
MPSRPPGSFELVQKAAAVGIPCLAALSAPTALALSLAETCGIGIATLSPEAVTQVVSSPQC